MHNLVEPVNKDLEFQLHEPFLLYRNASCEYIVYIYQGDLVSGHWILEFQINKIWPIFSFMIINVCLGKRSNSFEVLYVYDCVYS